jgi:hypothetical protein
MKTPHAQYAAMGAGCITAINTIVDVSQTEQAAFVGEIATNVVMLPLLPMVTNVEANAFRMVRSANTEQTVTCAAKGLLIGTYQERYNADMSLVILMEQDVFLL